MNPPTAFAEVALAEWANMVREFYAPRDPKLLMPSLREVYEPSQTERTARRTDQRPDPVLAALIGDESAGRRLARTVHNWLTSDNEGSFQMRRRGDLALLFWLEQEGATHEQMGKELAMRKGLIGTALRLGKIDLTLYLRVVFRRG